MNKLEQQFFHQEIGPAEPCLCICTATRVDTGRWWRASPVWLCVTDDELVMLAVARRRYLERISIADCPGTHYNSATGELVIEPGESLPLNRFKLSPRDALRVLNLLNSQPRIPKTEPC